MSNNVKAVLAYLFQVVGGVIVFFFANGDKFVRFHAAQSIVAFSSISLLRFVNYEALHIPFASAALNILALVIMVVGIIKAYNNEMYRFPIIADLTDSIFFKNDSGGSNDKSENL